MVLTDQQKKEYVDKHITKIYPQLVINTQKTLGAAFPKHGGDLLALSLEFFLNKPLDVQYDACKNNKCENFVTFIMGFQSKSGSSKFYHEYRKFNESIRDYYVDHHQYDIEKQDKYEDDDLMVCIKNQIDKLNPYEKMLVEERIFKGMRYVDIAKRYDIPYASLRLELDRVLTKIKVRCKHYR